MKYLSATVMFKIAITAIFWFGLPMFAPLDWLHNMGYPLSQENEPFVRLLAMAYGALMVGYVFGWLAIRRGEYPLWMVWMGIVSNGGAFSLLLLFKSRWAHWTPYAHVAQWGSLIATGIITSGLLVFGALGVGRKKE